MFAPEREALQALVDKTQEKVTGTGIYPDDIYLDGMIYGSAGSLNMADVARLILSSGQTARVLRVVPGERLYGTDDADDRGNEPWDTFTQRFCHIVQVASETTQ